ncbi:MAG: hypothetical protein KKF27_21830 [Gammaproteobacteria bacterium]|nr:hypothetical protein [Gammaproteobacteria bacterium]
MSEPIVFCTATDRPNNIFKRFGAEFTLVQSKARHYERKGLVRILRPVSGPSTVTAKPQAKPTSATAIFFVFTGEMGYEILSSHGWLRKLKTEHPELTIGVASRAGVEFLYEGACDIYVEIKDVLAPYMSDCFGVEIKAADKQTIYGRCLAAAAKRGIGAAGVQCVYSSSEYSGYGSKWGRHERVASLAYKNHETFLQQHWTKLTLAKYGAEREELLTAFPALRSARYCVLHDRRRCCSWGHEMIVSERTWLVIIEKLKRAGYLPVLVAYKPWKHQDAESVFAGERFQGIPGTINLTGFLTKNLDRNMLFQALLLQGADWQLSPWGTAGKLPCLVGGQSYMLTIGRKRYEALVKTAAGWNKAFHRCGGNLTALNCVAEHDSIMGACDGAGLFGAVPCSLRGKITVLIPTSWVPSCPSAKLVETVVRSLERIRELDGCRCIVGFDAPGGADSQNRDYVKNLSQIRSRLKIEVRAVINARQRKSFLSLIRECATDYFLFWEHDWDWLRLPDMPVLVADMDADRGISAVYFSKRDNTQGAKMGDNAEVLKARAGGKVPLLKTNRWSNNPQLCRRSKWGEWFPVVEAAPLQWPGQKPSKQIEPALHFKYLDEIKRDGFDTAHARWGMYVYGKIGDKAMVRHLDGKRFR